MVQTQTFPRKFEQPVDRMMPSQARSILHRVARDVSRSIVRGADSQHQLNIGHAALHMKLYQRFGRRASDFMQVAHEALDDLVRQKASMHIDVPLRFGTALT